MCYYEFPEPAADPATPVWKVVLQFVAFMTLVECFFPCDFGDLLHDSFFDACIKSLMDYCFSGGLGVGLF